MNNSRVPEATVLFRHRTPIQKRFADIDMFGHVNNGAYLQYADTAKFAFFTELMDEPFDPAAIGLVIASIKCDFYAQTFMKDKIEVLTAVTHIGNTSLTLEQRIVDADANVHAIVTSVMVQLDPATGIPTPISQAWRDKLQS